MWICNFQSVIHNPCRLRSSHVNNNYQAQRILWVCLQFLQGNLEWQELTKPNLDQNWKTSKPNTLTSGFTNSPEFKKAYRFKLLKSLMNLGKSVLIV